MSATNLILQTILPNQAPYALFHIAILLFNAQTHPLVLNSCLDDDYCDGSFCANLQRAQVFHHSVHRNHSTYRSEQCLPLSTQI